MSNGLNTLSDQTLQAVILTGDLSRLDARQKVEYVVSLCQRVGLDPATQPFKLLKLNGKEIPYADRGCAAQLNQLHGLSHQIMSTDRTDDSIIMVDRCTGKDGRYTEEVGAVPLAGLKGEALTDAIMKCRTKAMRRSTLTHVGLGFLDESETETIPGAQTVPLPTLENKTEEIEWTDDEREAAKASVSELGERLYEAGLDPDAVEGILAEPRKTIGDPTVSLDKWTNRFLGYRERKLKKHGVAA